jgi:UDP-N-acetylglucosamine 2-epimerase (non-hydrolysing)
MTAKRRVLCIVGTRPEGIKMAPVIRALQQQPWAEVRVLTTAQHRGLLDQVLSLFEIRPDLDLDVMKSNQTLAGLTSKLVARLDAVLADECPAMVIAQGDTTTVMCAALACFYRRIPFAHVEAGLRTGNRDSPFPEEMNRVFAGYLSQLHFAPTASSRLNLLRESIADESIHVTGNTVIDALLYQVERCDDAAIPVRPGCRRILVTAHRRESFGSPFAEVCAAIRTLVERFEDIEVLYPVHPNPNVRQTAYDMLGDHSRISLCEPLGYREFVAAMRDCTLILSDSGGVQEEAPALAKPVLVLRNETERPEAVEAGAVRLVGPNYDRIVEEASRLLQDEHAYAAMARGISPYGDGHAAERIVAAVRAYLD